MSKDNVKQMFAKMAKDSQLQKKYTELMQAHQKETEKNLSEKLINFGKTSGFMFSNEDLLAARAEFIDKNNSNNELSDIDLVNVTGGDSTRKTLQVLASILTFGELCEDPNSRQNKPSKWEYKW